VLWITDLFPHAGRPYKGAPLVDLAREISRRAELLVLTPCYRFLWTPEGSFLEWYRGQALRADYGGVRAIYPRAPASPWAFYMALQSASMAWALLPAAREEHRRRRFDVVHGHSIIPGGAAGAWIAGRLGLPLVVTAHGSDVTAFGSVRHLRPFFSAACRRAARLTAVSRDLVARLGSMGYPEARWVPNGCAAVASGERPRVRGRILFVGTLWEWKGTDVLLRAFDRVRKDVPGATLDLVGEGSGAAALRAEADRLGLGSAVRWLGVLPNARVRELMEEADVLCLPSRREGFPLVLLEALAAGVPAVATAVGGIPEIISRPELGEVVPPGDAEALGAALVRALGSSWDREALRREARRYDWGGIAEEYLGVYREAIAARRIRSTSAAIAAAE
jgi:glycosyltransferase involved in cell wall biosynthesis